ncbi:MAG: AbrB/MazE/SpoVT family DNA-binding domain-containing protein [Kiritimatiellae bacterium]|jgi:antitoxin PrlF|nr:AbrB/MazE/SpoVT family DNA-binding domain-containing protein [Kiritimatiellia bacterium]
MVTATITSKGQITVPKSIRASLHLATGDKVAFVRQANGETVLKPITRSVDDVFGILHKKNATVCSVDQMNEAVKKRIRNQRS